MYIKPISILKSRLDNLLLELADRYWVSYNVIRSKCSWAVKDLLECWLSSIDPFIECEFMVKILEECVEELGDGCG